MGIVKEDIKELLLMKNYPKELFYEGNLDLLKRKKISIVGSRTPLGYSRTLVQKISSTLSSMGICLVSGGAIGIDAIVHKSAKPSNTIAVLPCGIDVRYPAINKNLLNDIAKEGLLLSQFKEGTLAAPWSFVLRNEIVVALGDVLIIGEADIDSGSMRSAEFALKMGKEIFVLPHRIDESKGTNELLKKGFAKPIYDIDEFASMFGEIKKEPKIVDEFLEFCKTNPTYEEAMAKYASRVFESELSGDIIVKNGRVIILA